MNNFTETTFSLAKALHHINNAKEYFTDVKRDCNSSIKNQFTQYIQKCDFIIDSITCKLTAQNKLVLKKELADSFLIEGINDKLIYLDEAQRNQVENFIDEILKKKS